jgi:hypothetical protein
MVKKEEAIGGGGIEKRAPLKNVFVEKIPVEILFELLEKICSLVEGRGVEKGIRNYYYLSDYEYRKMVFDGLHTPFLNSIRPYYTDFFARYCEREFTYNAFKTIVRQICKIHGVRHEKQSFVVNSEITVAYCIYV